MLIGLRHGALAHSIRWNEIIVHALGEFVSLQHNYAAAFNSDAGLLNLAHPEDKDDKGSAAADTHKPEKLHSLCLCADMKSSVRGADSSGLRDDDHNDDQAMMDDDEEKETMPADADGHVDFTPPSSHPRIRVLTSSSASLLFELSWVVAALRLSGLPSLPAAAAADFEELQRTVLILAHLCRLYILSHSVAQVVPSLEVPTPVPPLNVFVTLSQPDRKSRKK